MKKLENILGIFSHKASRPIVFKKLFGVNQLSACDRDGSMESYDFIGTIDEVNAYEKRWCNKGSNGFGFLGVEVIKGFKEQFWYCGKQEDIMLHCTILKKYWDREELKGLNFNRVLKIIEVLEIWEGENV